MPFLASASVGWLQLKSAVKFHNQRQLHAMNATLDSMLGLFVLYGGGLLSVVVAIGYARKSGVTSSVLQRVLGTAFGVSIALVFLFAVLLWPEGYQYNAKGRSAYFAMQLLPLVGLAVSLVFFTGPRFLHGYFVPLGCMAWLWVFSIGYLAVNGK